MAAVKPMFVPAGEDANPMNRRLPAEVITRQRRQPRKEADKPAFEEVVIDLRTATAGKAEARLKWLTKACAMLKEGRAPNTELYNIVSSRKFAAGVPVKTASKMRELIEENINSFSDKQQRHLTSDEWVLREVVKDPERDDGHDSDAAPGEPVAPAKAEGEEYRIQWRQVNDAASAARRTGAEVARRRAEKTAEEEHRRRQAEEQRRRAEAEAEEAADSSLQLLERLGQQRRRSPPGNRGSRSSGARGDRGRGNMLWLSRSRSISSRAAKKRRRSGSRKKGEKGKKKRKGSSSSSSGSPKVSFRDKLEARLREREARDTVRTPIVDPGHAQRNWH